MVMQRKIATGALEELRREGPGGPCLTAAARGAAPDVPFVDAATPRPERWSGGHRGSTGPGALHLHFRIWRVATV